MKIFSWVLIFLGVVGLIGVRIFENDLFYDPFLSYFHLADKTAEAPHFQWDKLIFSHVFRFALNLIFSLVIIQFLFSKRTWTWQAALMILLIFIITFPIYLYCISNEPETKYLFTFYIRRFVIQPVILLLIVPLFYYRKKSSVLPI